MYRFSNQRPLILQYSIILFSILFLFTGFPAQANNEVSDKSALQNVQEVKAVFDVRVKEPKRFAFFLEVIGKTYDGIRSQGPRPDFVVAVRGPSIRFVSSETWSFSEVDQKHLKDAAALMRDLKSRGIKLEACSIAAGLFKVDHKTYLPEINPVSNTFISLTGYQAQGYGLVPVN